MVRAVCPVRLPRLGIGNGGGCGGEKGSVRLSESRSMRDTDYAVLIRRGVVVVYAEGDL